MSNSTAAAPRAVSQPAEGWLAGAWLQIFLILYGIWIWLPFLAPTFMHIGWSGAGRTLYFIYSFFCHQLPERSYFLFGQKTMYSLPEIQSAWQNSFNPLVLRQFIGNTAMGWKVAWSDRMISFYGGVWAFAILLAHFAAGSKPCPGGDSLFCCSPLLWMGAHICSAIPGIGQGFRYTNQWLAILTNHVLSASFYAGDALGSFNSWMRIVTGLLAGLGIVWFAFPHLEQSFAEG